ncbi:MAG: 2-hydroxyacyl-CoA dehydratase [Armatimonadetes bacterium]|nr:2-hydroxyacyl-CoA dehydratase [Armatimonadota bacterium]
MHEFLDLCGYEEAEMAAELPRIEKTFTALGISSADIDEAKSRVRKYYDIDLPGVRKILRVFLRDLTGIVLMREEGREKFGYSFMAPSTETLGSAIMCNSGDVGWMNPGWTFLTVLGCIFNKLTPALEAAEKLWLKTGIVAHCGNVKMDLGFFALDLIPKPNLIVTAGFLCDTSSKSHDLVKETYGIPSYYLDCWQDREWREFPNARRAIRFLAQSMRQLVEQIRRETGFQLTDQMLSDAIEMRKGYAEAKSRVVDIIRHSDPVPLSGPHLNLLFCLDAIPFTVDEAAYTTDALDTLYDGLLERREKGVGPTPKGAPRVLVVSPNHHADPRWEYEANQMGIALVASDFEFSTGEDVSSGALVDQDDPYDVLAQHLHVSYEQILAARIAIIEQVCRDLDLDGVLNHYHAACRYVAADAMLIKSEINRRLGIPVLTFEWDNFDPRSFDHSERYQAELETFKEMMEAARRQ